MTKKKVWSETFELNSILPIDISLPKAYVLANVPFDENHWTRVFMTQNNQIVVARVTQLRPMTKVVQLKIEAQGGLSPSEIEHILNTIRFEIGLDEKMAILRKMQKTDPLIDIAVKSIPGFRIYCNSNTQEAAVLTIMSQNTSFFSYLVSVKLFYRTFGVKVPWDKSLRGFPDNATIASITSNQWKKINMGYKHKFLAALDEITLENIEIYTNYPIIERGLEGLLKIKGIGHYTARCLFIYVSRRYEYGFLDTYVREVLQHKYELMGITTITEFDKWIRNRWPTDPALILHALLQEYLPVYLQAYRDEDIN